METLRLIIEDRLPQDVTIEWYYLRLHPELEELDPSVGEAIRPQLYSIFTKPEDEHRREHIGLCSLYNYTGIVIELGVRIFNPEYWNKGYGVEIVNALCEFAISNAPVLECMYVKTPAQNTRAIRCYEKCGFVQYAQATVDGYDMVFMKKRR